MSLELLKSYLPYVGVVGLLLYVVKSGLVRWNKQLVRTTSFPECLFSLASTGGFFTSFLNIHK